MPELIDTWRLPDGSLFRIQKTLRKGKEKIVLQNLKGTTWNTYQTLNIKHLPTILENVEQANGVKIPYPK